MTKKNGWMRGVDFGLRFELISFGCLVFCLEGKSCCCVSALVVLSACLFVKCDCPSCVGGVIHMDCRRNCCPNHGGRRTASLCVDGGGFIGGWVMMIQCLKSEIFEKVFN